MLLAFAYPYTYIAKGWVHKYPSHTACCYEFLPCFSLHLFHHLGYSSLCPCVCPHYTRMTREELANLRITDDVKGVEGCCLLSRPLPFTFSLYLQFLFLLWCPPFPYSFSYFFPFFFCASFLFQLVPTSKRRILSKKKLTLKYCVRRLLRRLYRLDFRSSEHVYSTSNRVCRFYKDYCYNSNIFNNSYCKH